MNSEHYLEFPFYTCSTQQENVSDQAWASTLVELAGGGLLQVLPSFWTNPKYNKKKIELNAKTSIESNANMLTFSKYYFLGSQS